MEIQSANNQLVNLERILNLPKEIFSAEQNLAKKMILMANADKIQSQADASKSAILDIYA